MVMKWDAFEKARAVFFVVIFLWTIGWYFDLSGERAEKKARAVEYNKHKAAERKEEKERQDYCTMASIALSRLDCLNRHNGADGHQVQTDPSCGGDRETERHNLQLAREWLKVHSPYDYERYKKGAINFQNRSDNE